MPSAAHATLPLGILFGIDLDLCDFFLTSRSMPHFFGDGCGEARFFLRVIVAGLIDGRCKAGSLGMHSFSRNNLWAQKHLLPKLRDTSSSSSFTAALKPNKKHEHYHIFKLDRR